MRCKWFLELELIKCSWVGDVDETGEEQSAGLLVVVEVVLADWEELCLRSSGRSIG